MENRQAMREKVAGAAAIFTFAVALIFIPYLPENVRPIAFIVYWVIFLYGVELLSGSRRER